VSADTTGFRVRTNRTGRRTYAREYKLEVAEQCMAPGASHAAVALSHGINANVVRKWVVEHRAGRLAAKLKKQTMLPVSIEPRGEVVNRPTVSAQSRHSAPGVIEIELDCARIRIRGGVDAQALRTVLDALAKR
jgi:transposase-like protein